MHVYVNGHVFFLCALVEHRADAPLFLMPPQLFLVLYWVHKSESLADSPLPRGYEHRVAQRQLLSDLPLRETSPRTACVVRVSMLS